MEGRGPRALYCSKDCTNKAWYERNRDAQLDRMKAWRDQNPDKMLAAVMRWKAAHPDRVNQIARDTYARTPETAKRSARTRRARQAGAGIFVVTQKDWRRLCERWGYCCAYCGAKRELQREHVIPLARGGRHSIGNILPACRPCNASKKAQLLVEWRYRPKGVIPHLHLNNRTSA